MSIRRWLGKLSEGVTNGPFVVKMSLLNNINRDGGMELMGCYLGLYCGVSGDRNFWISVASTL